MVMTKNEALKAVRAILSDTINYHGQAVIVTRDAKGIPHASWMGTLGSKDLDFLLTMTSPDSRKVDNILQNPNVEWMFTDHEMISVVYLRGKARVIHEIDELVEGWNELKDKSRAYFLKYIDDFGITFLILETKIEEIGYTRPIDNIYEKLVHLSIDYLSVL
jgi:general stress protein 26